MTDTIWTPDLSGHPGPKYAALAHALRDAVAHGDLPGGARLPPVRDLAWRLAMTPGTVARAYQIVTQEGLLSAEVGRGTFVAQAARPAPLPEPQGVDMRSLHLPDVGQGAEIARALRNMADRAGAEYLDYPSQTTEAPLRRAVVDWMAARVLGPVGAGDVALVSGGQAGIALVMQSCLTGPAPVVLLEDLAYPGFRHLARLSRAEPVALRLDGEGVRPDALEAACRRHAPQLICLTPLAQNPTAVCMGLERRNEIVAIARAYNLQILEDECYSTIHSDLPALRALAPERTWHVGSLSKTVSPSLRFGYVICPVGAGEVGRVTAQRSFFALARPVADLCLDLMTSGAAARLRQAVQDEQALRLQMVVNRLGAFELAWLPGLPFVWLRLPTGWRASGFARAAEAAGVMVRNADEYALNHGRAPNAVRLTLPGSVTRARFDAALAVLARLLCNPPAEMAV